MAMFVNTNVASLSGQRNLQNVTDRMNSSFEKLSSGSRINSARDDAAGLQISDRLSTQITGLSQANRNSNDAISIAQIAEGALSEVTNNVQRMRQLVVQGGNRTLSADDRSALGDEFSNYINTNESIADRTAYGTIKVLNYDSNEAGFQVQSGAQSGESDTVTTGNAKLTSLFGDLLTAEGVSGDMSGLFLGSAPASAPDFTSMGTMGKLIAANMIQTGESIASAAAAALFTGLDSVNGISTNFSQIATTSTIQIDVDALTAILTADKTETAGSAVLTGDQNIIVALSNNATALLGFSAAANYDSPNCAFGGLDDTQLNAVNAFATDTLLDMMSGMVTEVDKQRSKLGAEQNGLASTVRSNTASIVNVSDSRARIMDTDFASETAELTRNQIIQQAATSILSQANQLPNAALSLLR
jgi:flagellin